MEDLASKKCLPHGRLKLLTQSEVKDYLSQLKTGWLVRHSLGDGGEFLESHPPSHKASAGQGKIIKEFTFEDFVGAMEFVNKVAVLAEDEGHHPDISIYYNKVEITLWTHFVKGLSENDFIVAIKIDNL